MVQGINGGGSLARQAIEAALQAARRDAARIEQQVAENLGAPTADRARSAAATEFEGSLTRAVVDGVRDANQQIGAVEALPEKMLSGEITDFHELASTLKQAELTFKFSLEVRNKLIDAYREVMRMTI